MVARLAGIISIWIKLIVTILLANKRLIINQWCGAITLAGAIKKDTIIKTRKAISNVRTKTRFTAALAF